MNHLAGIIPVANLKTDFEFNFPEVLLPLNNGFTAIQKSVVECAYAGCSTIWIVANPDLAPVVRKTIGDWIYDPVYLGRSRYGQGSEYRREIPIYYVNILPKNTKFHDARLAIEKQLLESYIQMADGNISKAAKLAGIGRRGFYKIMERTKGQKDKILTKF